MVPLTEYSRLLHGTPFWLQYISGYSNKHLMLFILCCAAKADRLKQAKQEAEKEIKAYKAQREEAFQKRMSDVSPTS